MLRLLCIIGIVLVLNSGTIVRSESPLPYCGYLSNTTASTCPGDLVEIRYPFWIENRTTDEAGNCTSYYPGFEVKCAANGRPVLNISNNLYYVLSTDKYEEGGGGWLSVVDVDIDAQECPQPRRNISFEEPRFFSVYSGYEVNMTFFYNCSKYSENVVQHVPCLYNNSTRGPSFALLEDEISSHQFDWYGNCEDAVLLSNWGFNDYPVKEDYTAALKSGFYLQWSYPVNCGNCELSGGKCWANETNQPTTPFHCNCTDGTYYDDEVDSICDGPYYDSYYGYDIQGCPIPLI